MEFLQETLASVTKQKLMLVLHFKCFQAESPFMWLKIRINESAPTIIGSHGFSIWDKYIFSNIPTTLRRLICSTSWMLTSVHITQIMDGVERMPCKLLGTKPRKFLFGEGKDQITFKCTVWKAVYLISELPPSTFDNFKSEMVSKCLGGCVHSAHPVYWDWPHHVFAKPVGDIRGHEWVHHLHRCVTATVGTQKEHQAQGLNLLVRKHSYISLPSSYTCKSILYEYHWHCVTLWVTTYISPSLSPVSTIIQLNCILGSACMRAWVVSELLLNCRLQCCE